MSRFSPLFEKTFHKYEKELGIDLDRDYKDINFVVNRKWEYKSERTPFEHVQIALKRDPKLRMIFINGIYDFQAVIGQASYAAAKLEAEEGQVIVREYPAGHMPYIGAESFDLLEKDLRDFIRVSR